MRKNMNISNFIKLTCLSLIGLSLFFAARSHMEEAETEKGVNSASNENRELGENLNQNIQETIQTTSPYDSLVIARYRESTVVLKANFAEEVMKSNNLSKAIGGRVYTFEIRMSICGTRSGKIDSTVSRPTKLSFFNEDGSGFYQPYEANKDYLIYLSAFPDQEKLKKDYELDEKTTYYNPYPFDGKKRTKHRVAEISGQLDHNFLAQLKEDCREQK